MPVPSKSENPVQFMAPFITALTEKAKELSPVRQEADALKELHAVQRKLRGTEAKLRASQQTPSPRSHFPTSVETPVGSEGVDEIEDFTQEETAVEEVKPPRTKATPPPGAGKRRALSSSSALGASPKAKQRTLKSWVEREKEKETSGDTTPEAPPPKALTASEVMNPSQPSMRDNQPSGSSAGEIKKWMETFDVETQQSAKKILQILGEQKYSKEKLQNAAAQYGLNVKESLKMTPKSLQQVISVAAAMTS